MKWNTAGGTTSRDFGAREFPRVHGPAQGRRTGWLVIVLSMVAVVGIALALYKEQVGARIAGVLAVQDPPVVIAQGTPITISLESRLSTKTSGQGDPFSATVTAPVWVDGRLAIPEGSRIDGHVHFVQKPGKASGRGFLQLAFDQVTADGHPYALGSRSARFQSKSGTQKDVEVIGGGAVAGGLLGGILGGEAEDVAKGVVVGGAAGTAVSLMTRGPHLEFAPGTQIRFTLDQPVEVRGVEVDI